MPSDQRRSRPCHGQITLRGAVLLFLLLSLFSAAPTAAATGVGSAEWSSAPTAVTPTGERFLGAFERAAVALTLADLPAHAAVTLTFDLYVIGSWDGNAGEDIGPDIFNVSHSGDQTLLNTTFSNYPGEHDQAYPGSYPGANNPGQTGASAVGTLGYALDATYALSFTFAHTADALQIKFAGVGLQGDGDEVWGLDNVTVQTDGQTIYQFDATSDTTDAVVEVAHLLAADRQADDALGYAVAVHEDLLAAGAPVWVADNLLDQNQRAGAVYLFARDPAGVYKWDQSQKLTPDDGAPNDRFGWTVTLDANLIAVGAPWADSGGNLDQGVVYLFAPSPAEPNRWVQIQKLIAPDGVADDRFGRAVVVNGGSLLVGAKEKAYLFYRGGDDQWSLVKTFIASDGKAGDRFGDSVALDGDVVLIGASGAQLGANYLQGAAYVYLRNQGGANNWGEFKKLTAPDGEILTFFGYPVLLADGQAIIGGNGKQQVYIFNRNASGTDTWAEVQRLTSVDGNANFGFGMRLAYHSQHLVVSGGSQAEVFERVPGDVEPWRPLRKVKGSAGSSVDFTSSLALSGQRLFVGGPGASSGDDLFWHGAVYLFDLTRPAAPIFDFAQAEFSVAESVGTAEIAVVLDRPSPYPLTIAYTTTPIEREATIPDDYTPVSGTLAIPTGATQASISVPIANDNLLELTERLRLALGNSPGGLAGEIREALITILDDDTAAPCNYVASDEESLDRAIRCLYVAEPGTPTIQVTADISLTRPLPLLTSPTVAAVTIAGNGHTIDAQGHGRVLAMHEIKLDMRDLTLRGGRLPQTQDWTIPNDGGGIYATTPNIGFAIEQSCALTLTNVVLTDNEAYSGGGLYYGCELPLTVRNSTISNNRAVYGGAFSTSGGEEFFTEAFVSGSTFSGNTATSSGGAFDLSIGDGGIILQLVNSTVSGNQAVENGGGLLLTQSAIDGRSEAQLINSTVANNTAAAGSGIYNRYGILSLSNSLIALNSGGSSCVFFVSEDGSGQQISHGYNLDSDGSCLPEGVRQPTDIPNGNANLGPLADNGTTSGHPTLTHALLAGSDALDQANNAVCLNEPVNRIDQRGVRRPQGSRCDIGAFELEVSTPALTHLLVSSSSSAQADGVAFRDEDIVAYDFSTASWSMIFDGSDVGITKDVDAFALLADESLLLSFNAATNVPGLGPVDDSDIVQFSPAKLGNETAGSFTLYLRGAAVGLSSDGEDIDLIDFNNGQLVVSTIGDFSTPNVSGQDEDLIQLDQASGAWSLFLDGAAAGLANEDINGLWIDPASGDRYLTVKDSFAFGTVAVDADDIFVCTPSPEQGCVYSLFWDGDLYNYGAENVDAIQRGALPTAFVASVQPSAAAPLTPAEAQSDDDADDQDEPAANNNLFLPVLQR